MTVDMEYAKVAANWWRKQLEQPQDMNKNAQLDNPMAGILSLMSFKAHTSAELDEFESELSFGILAQVETHGHAWLEVDYHPSHILSKAIELSGLKYIFGQLPSKTNMRITKDKVEVKCGYGAGFETLWEAKQPEQS